MRSTRVVFFTAAALAAAALPAARAFGTLASSTFDTNADGWTTTDDPGTTVAFTATDGNPPGALVMDEIPAGATDFFIAPGKFLGNLSGNFGGHISFDLKPSGTPVPDTTDGDLVLSGPGGALVAFLPNPLTPGAFTRNAFALDTTTSFHFDSPTGPLATTAEIQSVLANVTSFKIRGDFLDGPDHTVLDNVFLTPAIPLPAALPAGLILLAALPFASKRLRTHLQ